MDDKTTRTLFPQRKYVRLRGYAYTWPGAYFVTICTHGKLCLFGNIEQDLMKLNPYGEIAKTSWEDIPHHYPDVSNEIFTVMPNHVHGIIIIRDADGRSGSKPDPTRKHLLSELVRAFKTYSSRRINERRNSSGTPVWQRSYYEHVIRNESEYHQISDYIKYNPANWDTDRENPYFKLKIPHDDKLSRNFDTVSKTDT